ncbi:MAG: PAS domain-containing sensor histidine kinase, partial [Bradymonadaceae bacterium]
QAYWDKLMEQKLEVPVALATGLAHEIRNPLNTLKLQMTLLRRRANELDDSAEETFEPIIESVENELQRIRGLTNDITDFAKPIELDAGWHDIESLVDELNGAYAASLETLEIDFQIDYEPDDQIWCDIDRLNQALINLIQNAVQAIDGQGRIRIEIATDDEGARLVVDDDGCGIPPDDQYAIFDMFHTTKASGTGLGLPIVRKIVDGHDGTVEVDSEPGDGTRFTIYLPFP